MNEGHSLSSFSCTVGVDSNSSDEEIIIAYYTITDEEIKKKKDSCSYFLQYPESVKLNKTECFITSSTNFVLTFCLFILDIYIIQYVCKTKMRN